MHILAPRKLTMQTRENIKGGGANQKKYLTGRKEN
jgi:hypothetical protein